MSKDTSLSYLKTTVLNPNQVACIRNHMGNYNGKGSLYPALKKGEEYNFAELTEAYKSQQSICNSAGSVVQSSMAPID